MGNSVEVQIDQELEIRPVRTKRDLNTFIRAQFEIYADEPNWIAPLIWERKNYLDRNKNPFFNHARIEYFLALRNGKPVGRISAHIDDHFQTFQKNKTGFFGFFESTNDSVVASALIDAAANWLEANGCDRMLGPCDFTTNDPCGVLIEGFEKPMILTPWNHSYYRSLLEGLDLHKAMDLLMWQIDVANESKMNPLLWKVAKRAETRHKITVRPMDKRNLARDLEIFRKIYNTAWQDNWGFVPLDAQDIEHYAKELKPIIDPKWTFICENEKGEPVAAALTLLDYNQVLRRLNGRLLPFGWIKALRYRRKIDRVRVLALGVIPQYRHAGIAALIYTRQIALCHATGVSGGEMGWVLESNHDMNSAMEAMHGRVLRKFRLYERSLGHS